MQTTELDERDTAMLRERQEYLNGRTTPGVGDWVLFQDGTERRISHVWDFPEDRNLSGYQTSVGGSYHLGPDYVSYSGGLYPCQSWGSLEPTDETRSGRCWFFHHNHWTGGNGIDVTAEFRVWRCTESPKN